MIPLMVAGSGWMRAGENTRCGTRLGSALDRALHGAWFIPMKKVILLAFAVLGLTACGVLAQGEPQIAYHGGPYDNTANNLGGRYGGGGGGGGGGM
jgi:hypothetical protein